MEQRAVEAMYDDLHEKRPFHDGTFKRWSDHRSPLHPYHYKDGVELWMSDTDLDPDGDFLKPPELPQQPSEEG